MVRVNIEGNESKWFFAIHDVPGTSAVVWPAIEHNVPGSDQIYFEFDLECRDIDEIFLPIVDLDIVEAMSYEWKSPMTQASNFPEFISSGYGVRACRAIAVGQVAPLLEVAARAAFWQLGLSTISCLAALCDVELLVAPQPSARPCSRWCSTS